MPAVDGMTDILTGVSQGLGVFLNEYGPLGRTVIAVDKTAAPGCKEPGNASAVVCQNLRDAVRRANAVDSGVVYVNVLDSEAVVTRPSLLVPPQASAERALRHPHITCRPVRGPRTDRSGAVYLACER
jgi:hypothetical protein